MKKAAKKSEIRNELTDGEYWLWRLHIEERSHAETRMELEAKKFSNMEKDIEIMRLKNEIYKSKVRLAREVLDSKKLEYNNFMSKLESDLGQSLKNKIIKDDFSIESIEISKEN